jgi:hypothetical protein
MTVTSALTSTYKEKPPLEAPKNKANQTHKCKAPDRADGGQENLLSWITVNGYDIGKTGAGYAKKTNLSSCCFSRFGLLPGWLRAVSG